MTVTVTASGVTGHDGTILMYCSINISTTTRSHQKKCRVTKFPTICGLPPHSAEAIPEQFFIQEQYKNWYTYVRIYK